MSNFQPGPPLPPPPQPPPARPGTTATLPGPQGAPPKPPKPPRPPKAKKAPKAPKPPKPQRPAGDGESLLSKLSALNVSIGQAKIKPAKLMHFCRFMSVFLIAGIPILEALETVRADTKDKRLKKLITQISTDLRAGETFSSSVAAHSKGLPGFFVHMVRAAEETGQLAETLGQLADYIDRDVEAKRKIKSAIMYPTIVIVMSMASVAVLIGFVLPRFMSFFEEFDAELPLPTKILIAISNFAINYGPMIAVGAMVTGVVLFLGNLTEQGKLVRDTVTLKTPMISTIVVYAVVERFCRVMAGMVQAGVPLPTALELAANGAGNRRFAQRVRAARQKMLSGGGLTGPLSATKMFPESAVQMLRVGEETGTLEQQLTEVSQFYGKELAYTLKKRTDMLEPLAVVIVGVLVGFVAVAIVSAVYGVYNGTRFE